MHGCDSRQQRLISCLTLLTAFVAAGCNESNFKGAAGTASATVTREFTQESYPVVTEAHIQGNAGEPAAVSFEQGEWGALDILVVIDNSGSMQEEQENLATKLGPLLSHIDKADWRIAVVTTDPRDGCQRALIKKGDPQATSKFANAVRAGTNGSGEERGFYQAVSGLTCAQSPWVRPDSTLVTLIVADEDNCHLDVGQGTNGYGCFGKADLEAAYLLDYLRSIRTLKKDAKVYGILWHPSTPKAQCSTALKQGDHYAEAIFESGGTWGSICESDYKTTLEAISKDVARILKYEFELGHEPDLGTLAITVDGQPWDKFTVTGKTVRFTEPPPFGSKVAVAYSHGKAGTLSTAFPVAKDAVAGSFTVEINGLPVPEGAYSWNAETKQLEFGEAPRERASIKISYKEQKPLNARFEIGKGVDSGSIKVWVDGKRVGGVSYDGETGHAVLSTPPPEEAKIKVTFKMMR